MTREENIRTILECNFSEIKEELIDIAVKNIMALSQEPCDDVVSRILTRMWNCRGKHTTSIDKVKMEQIIRDELPSVTQKSKTGHWKRISMDKYTTHAQYWYECDKCGEHNLGNTDYCPSCGAKMVEPQESEDKE